MTETNIPPTLQLVALEADDAEELTLPRLLAANHELQRDNARLRARARTRRARARMYAIVAAVLASLATLGVMHAAGDAATKGGTGKPTLTSPCRPQHLVDCKHAVRWWRKVAREAQDAIEWQKNERRRLRDLLLGREAMGDVEAWACIHSKEGAWNDTGDPYWGGLQMDRSFMRTYGADMIRRHNGGLANTWTPQEQMIVAERARKVRGFAPWPRTARFCGYL